MFKQGREKGIASFVSINGEKETYKILDIREYEELCSHYMDTFFQIMDVTLENKDGKKQILSLDNYWPLRWMQKIPILGNKIIKYRIKKRLEGETEEQLEKNHSLIGKEIKI